HNYTSHNLYQLSVISYQLSVISYQLPVISYQLSAISYQLSAISYQLSVISYWFDRVGSISPLSPLNQVFMSSYFESLARNQF
ncbi:MAG: hypothetical protein ACK5UO_17685, partial [Microcystis sp.]|uniref:hypothetical protein n=1 Tax=Microcystis sp. TaxID=1127 RepID=UPI00391BB3CA